MKSMLSICLLVLGYYFCHGENLVANGDFLQLDANGKPVGWRGSVHPDSGPDTRIRPEGKNSYRLAGDQLLSTTVRGIKPGHVYDCSFILKTEGFKWRTAASFQILWRDKDDRYLFTEHKGQKVWDMKIRNIQGGHNWEKFMLNGCVAPPDAASAEIRIGQVFEPAGFCWFTGIRMAETKEGDPFMNRIAAIPYSETKLSIEGIFDESKWRNAALLSDYLQPVSGSRAHFKSETRICYDDEAIWLLIKNFQPDSDAFRPESGNRFDMQDAVEVFFLPPDQEYQYHLILPVSGELFACTEKWNDGNWPMKLHPWENNGIKTKLKFEKDYYLAGIRIPFSGMKQKAPETGTEWRAGFGRTVYTGGREISAWSFLREEHFQFSGDFGKIIFSRGIPLVRSLTITADGANAELYNPTAKPMTAEASLVHHIGDKSFLGETKTAELPPGRSTILDIPGKSDSGKMRFLEIRSGGNIIAKHCNKPAEEYLALSVFDPEGVRSQTVHLAVDTPFFMSFNMRHNFKTQVPHRQIWRKEIPFDLYMELPEGIKISGMTFDAGDWLKLPLFKPEITGVQEGGEKRNIYKFELPMIINWVEPSFLFFYECALPEGLELSGSYYMTNNGAAMPRHEMKFKTMKIGRLHKKPEKFVFDPGLLRANTLRWWFPRDTVRQYTALGFNRLSIIVEPVKNETFYSGGDPRTQEDYFDLIFQEIKDSGEKIFYSTFNTTAGPRGWYWTSEDPDARSIGYDGKPGPKNQYNYPSLCPTYRGKYYRQWVDELVNCSAFRKYRSTWLALDMELWPREVWEKICFCPRCLKRFNEFCIRNGKEDYARRNAAEEIAGKTDKEFTEYWAAFKREVYSEFINTAAEAVAAAVKGFPPTSPLGRFTVSDWGPHRDMLKDDVLDYFELAFFNSPDNNYRMFMDRRKEWMNLKGLYCTSTFGQTAGCPDFHITPRQVKENIFEAAAFGMKGMGWYYVLYLEPRRMKAVIDGANAIVPFEDVIIDGKISSGISGTNPAMLLSRLDCNGEMLIGVRGYGAASDLHGTIRLEGIGGSLNIYDCETREQVGSVTPASPEFSCTVAKDRCRLLYAGSPEQWDRRTAGL